MDKDSKKPAIFILERKMKKNFFGLLILIAITMSCAKSEPISAAEKALLLTVEDFADLGIEKFDPGRGIFAKEKNIDRSQELNYEYESDSSAGETPFYLYCSISLEKSKSDTSLTQSAQKIGLLIGFKKSGVKEKPLVTFPKYGDQSSMGLLEKDARPIGNVFMMVSGNKNYFLVFSGLFIDDPQVWNKVFGPKKELFEKFKMQ
jgi:hypothetical protein